MILTHGDLDGFVSAIVASRIYNIKLNTGSIYVFSYESNRDELFKVLLDPQLQVTDSLVSNVDPVVFTDLSLRLGELEWARNKPKRSKWVWYDHHISSEDFDPEGIFDQVNLYTKDDKCAADMLYEEYKIVFHNRPVDPILRSWVELAHDRDLWINDLRDQSVPIDKLVKYKLYNKSDYIKLMVRAMDETPLQIISSEMKIIERAMGSYYRSVDTAKATVQIYDKGRVPIKVAYITGDASDVAEELYEGIDWSIIAMIQVRTDGVSISLRTRRKKAGNQIVDLADIAKQFFSGGGHQQAAGGKLNASHLSGGFNAIARDISSYFVDKKTK